MPKLVLAAFMLACAGAAVSSAGELKPPLVPPSDIRPNSVPGAGCPLWAPGPVVGARLVVLNSLRDDVGPYSVTLLGYAVDKGKDSYRPSLIRAKPGDTLRIDLVNQLDESEPDNIVNLHTHRMIVAPRPYFSCNSLETVSLTRRQTMSKRFYTASTSPRRSKA
jgi:hypothetical protein